MIKPINIFEAKRYERMKRVGRNLNFESWMISVESEKIILKEIVDLLFDFLDWVIKPIVLVLKLLRLLYMLIPKVFIRKAEKELKE